MTGSRIASAIALVVGCSAVTGACRGNPEKATYEYMRSGDRYAAAEKYQEASIEYRNATKQTPTLGEAHLKLAETYERLGNTWKALEEYVHASDLLPGNATLQIKAANALLLAGQFEGAKARAEKALAVAPKNVEALIAKGNALAGLKYLDAAVTEIEDAIHESPDRSASYASLGALELARGNRAHAEEAFRTATALDPTSVRARLALAHFYWGTDRLSAAEAELKAALDMSPRDIPANRALAVFYLATNRAALAEPHLKLVVDASTQGSGRLVLAFVLAEYYVSTDRSAEAKTLLQALTHAGAQGFTEATIRLSALAARSGDTAGAHTLIDQVLQRYPDNVDALVARADLFLGESQKGPALASAEEAVTKAPRAASAHDALARVHAAQQNWAAATVAYSEALELNPRLNTVRLALARLSLGQGKPDDAIRLAREALRVQPGSAEATMILARALLSKGDAEGAEVHVTQLAKAFPASASAQIGLGQLQVLKSQSRSAREAFERALTIEPANIEALSGLTALDMQAKHPAAARARIDASLASHPGDPRLLLLSARLSVALGDVVATERTLRRVIEADPGQIEAYALLGQFYASQHRLDEARAEFEQLAQRRPLKSAVWAQTVVGIILQMQNQPNAAQVSYEKVLLMDPTAAVAANNLAWLYAEGGAHLDMALHLAESARAKLPDSHEVRDTLAWVYYKKGMTNLAVPLLRESVDQSPTNAVYRYHLGLAYAKNGNIPEARQALEQALALHPQFNGSADARRVLAGLRG